MPEKAHDDLMKTTAKALGKAVGKIASLTGAAEPSATATHKHSGKKAKLQKKNKPHLPRKEKKAKKKAAAQSHASH